MLLVRIYSPMLTKALDCAIYQPRLTLCVTRSISTFCTAVKTYPFPPPFSPGLRLNRGWTQCSLWGQTAIKQNNIPHHTIPKSKQQSNTYSFIHSFTHFYKVKVSFKKQNSSRAAYTCTRLDLGVTCLSSTVQLRTFYCKISSRTSRQTAVRDEGTVGVTGSVTAGSGTPRTVVL